ncbi:MAG: UDP-2,3-diacylglucosamine diphosphatase [Gammaproteobacteria bacterium RIFCSPLOWO2_02_FULL_57_10]|nr:MAG: UDP-2,3-diacylglucosamine diphosphatase [Gammaproteobacteria bacterium RIFCSPLOWO2_02_FULL_57_10]
MSDIKKSLFISDLHLDSDNSVITASFLNFLSTRAAGSESLYILGDLFEVWVGDDDHNHLTDTVATALSALAATGTRIYLMHGNRDFLLGPDYAARCGATLIQEPAIIDCHGHRVLLIHGDSLCTRDTEYMKFRKLVRSERWQNEFLEKSLVERHMIAQQARQQSKEHTGNKASDIMDVTHQEVLNLLHEKQVNTLVHGHTHRPAVHTIRLQEPINGRSEALRIVLGSWDSKGWALEFTESGFDLKYFPLQAPV